MTERPHLPDENADTSLPGDRGKRIVVILAALIATAVAITSLYKEAYWWVAGSSILAVSLFAIAFLSKKRAVEVASKAAKEVFDFTPLP